MTDRLGEGLPEAPVSWNARYRSPQGFDCQLTLRGTEPADVLRMAADLLDRMVAAGCTPTNGYHKATGDVGNGNANTETKPCPLHPGEMLRKHTKDGRAWWSHKVEATGKWCRGKPSGGGQ